jgi:hypothetical protein
MALEINPKRTRVIEIITRPTRIKVVSSPDELELTSEQKTQNIGGNGDVMPTPTNGGGGPSIALPHYFWAGPSSGSTAGTVTFRPAVPDDIAFTAILAKPNVFSDVNRFPGLRVGRKTVSSNYSITPLDYEILVNAVAGPITITQLPASGLGQINRVKKIDPSDNAVTIVAQTGDFINDSTSTLLDIPQQGVTFIDAAVNYWDSNTLPPNVAYVDADNVFTGLNEFNGIKFTPKFITANYFVQPGDFGLLVDTTSGPVELFLPPSIGEGQLYHIKKVSSDSNIATITADGADLIDGSVSVNLIVQYADCLLYDESAGSWGNIGAAVGGVDLPLELSGMRIKDDGYLQLWNPDQSKYFTIQIRGAVGEEYFDLVRPGEA